MKKYMKAFDSKMILIHYDSNFFDTIICKSFATMNASKIAQVNHPVNQPSLRCKLQAFVIVLSHILKFVYDTQTGNLKVRYF